MKSRVTRVGLIFFAMLAMPGLLFPAMTSAVNLNGFWEQDYGTYSIFGNDTTHTYYRWNGTGQGWSHSNISTGNWCYLGKFLDVGAPNWYFPGDGAWHNVDAKWAYSYAGGAGSWWTPSVGFTVFAYNYANTQWYNQGATGGWAPLGSGGMSAAFMGDGAWHNMSATWAYQYVGGAGSWWTPSVGTRVFSYNYGTGQWYDAGKVGGWAPLGSGGMSAAFMGDGAWHNLSATWAYNYSGGAGSWWTPSAGFTVFAYSYANTQWYNQGATGGWAPLGSGGMSAAFMGDGAWHNLNANWAYNYAHTNAYWWTPSVGASVLAYNYGAAQWLDAAAAGGGWQTLSPGGSSAVFIGDGDPHVLANNWSYTFGSGVANWTNTSSGAQFMYNYGSLQWSYHDSAGWHVATYSPVTTTVTNSFGTGITLQVLFGYGNAALYGNSPGFSSFTQSTNPDIYLCHLAPNRTVTFTYINPNPTRSVNKPGDAFTFVADGQTFNDAAQTRFEYNFNCSVDSGKTWQNEVNLSLVNGYNGGMDLWTGLGEHVYAYTAWGNSKNLGVYGLGCDLGKAIYQPPYNYYNHQGNRVLDLHDASIPWEVYDTFGGKANSLTLTILPSYGFDYKWLPNDWAGGNPAPNRIQPW